MVPFVSETPTEELDLTTERILAAAREQFELEGIKRSSVEAIARRAGVTRVTVYRRYPRKDVLVEAVIGREARALIAEIDERTSAIESADERTVECFVLLLGWFREHALVRRMLTTEPESVLRALTVDAGSVIAIGTAYVADQIRRAQREGEYPEYDPEPAAEIFARFIQSLILTPDELDRFSDDDDARAFARAHIAPMLKRQSSA